LVTEDYIVTSAGILICAANSPGGVQVKHVRILSLAVLAFAVLLYGCSSSIDSENLEDLIEQEGIEAAIEKLRDLGTAAGDEYDLSTANLLRVGEDYYRRGEHDVALALGRFAAEIYPDSVATHRTAALVCKLLGLRSEARDHITRAFALDTLNLPTLVQMKGIMFVPPDFTPPEPLVTKNFRIRPILPEDAELDYEAIMTSLDHLKGVLGRKSWPSPDMTLEENRQSLVGHSRQHKTREAFCYTVMNQDESECLGCVYLYPSRWDDHDAEVVMWVSKAAFDRGLDSKLFSTAQQWLADEWSFKRVVFPGREVSWGEFFNRLDQQDKLRHW
jgi:tetratricopeptide (TPR) repeat protein